MLVGNERREHVVVAAVAAVVAAEVKPLVRSLDSREVEEEVA